MAAPQRPQGIPQPTNGRDSRADLTVWPPRPRSAPRSRVGGMWVAAVLFALVLLLLLIFLLQNGQRADVSFFGAHGQLPMGVALLLAAIFGILLVALPGTVRIMQLRTLSGRQAAGGRRIVPRRTGEPAGTEQRTAGHRADG